MANTYKLIASSTVGSGGAANIEFTSIPATYTDLLIKYSARSSNSSFGLYITINASSPHAITSRFLEGDGSTVNNNIPGDNIAGYIGRSTQTASTFSNGELYFPNYLSGNNKSFSSDSVNETNGTSAFSALAALLWSNTAAITSIKLTAPTSATFVQYSTAYLYGISNS
jgi:hypothetical protein